jgi:hypothetical protein
MLAVLGSSRTSEVTATNIALAFPELTYAIPEDGPQIVLLPRNYQFIRLLYVATTTFRNELSIFNSLALIRKTG